MKNKIKFLLIPNIVTLTMSSFTLASCSNDNINSALIQQTVNEFYEICKYPHPSYNLDKIRKYLTSRAKQLGYTAERDDYGNIWFDVPSNDDKYDTYPTLILQGHMDMVFAGDVSDKNKPIIPEYHKKGNFLTSEGNKTSLGADNGIGLGLAFALIKDDKIKHGPLRILITADEEPGLIGANNLNPNALKDNKGDWLKYLISLDGEVDDGGVYVSCAGGVCYKLQKQFSQVSTQNTKYKIVVSGLKGGHSGNDIGKLRANAEKFIFEGLNGLNNDKQIQLINFGHGENVYENNALIPYAECEFTSGLDSSVLNSSFNNLINQYKSIYKDDDGINFQLSPSQTTSKALSLDDSSKIITMIGANLKFGIFDKTGLQVLEPTERPIRSANIGPTSLVNGKFSFQKYDRAIENTIIDTAQNEILSAFTTAGFSKAESESDDGYTLVIKNTPWEENKNDKIVELCKKGFNSINITPYERRTNGCVEPSVFKRLNKDLQLSCVGTKFENVHTVNETCYLSVLDNTSKALLYVLEHINEIE